jgi:hypothetical protein
LKKIFIKQRKRKGGSQFFNQKDMTFSGHMGLGKDSKVQLSHAWIS